MDKVLQEQVQRVHFSESPTAKSPPPGFPRLCVPISSSTDDENVPPSSDSSQAALNVIGPGGDCCPAQLKEGISAQGGSGRKKKTRGTRGGRKNRMKKEMNRKRQFISNSNSDNITQKRVGSAKKIQYSIEQLVNLRNAPRSRGPPGGVGRIERRSSSSRPVEIFPVSFLPTDNKEHQDILITKKIDEICERIMKMDPNDQIQGIEPHFLRVKKGKNSDLDSSACSSMVQTPRDSGVGGSDGSPRELSSHEFSSSILSPRETESVAEIRPNLGDNNTDVTEMSRVDSLEPENDTIEPAVKDTKFKMRPPKSSDDFTKRPIVPLKSSMYESANSSVGYPVEYMMPMLLPTWPNPYYGSYSNPYNDFDSASKNGLVPICPYIPYPTIPTFYPYIPYPVTPTCSHTSERSSTRTSTSTSSEIELLSGSSNSR